MMRSALLLLALASCNARAVPTEPTVHAPPAAKPAPAPVARAPLGPSVYDLPVQLVTATGEHVGLDVDRGKPVIVAMFYASCTVACPLLVSEVGQVLAELPADLQPDVRVLLVSFDGARDTPAVLAALAHERKLDARWTLAAANDTDARALAAVLGVKYRKLANGDFAHGSTIVALDGEGREVARTDALGQRDPVVRGVIAYH